MTELLPLTGGICLTDVTVEDTSEWLQLMAIAPTAVCPACAAPLSPVYNRYQRHLRGLPWGTRAVRLQLMVRKFLDG
jgi:hypothetical protein